MKKAKMRKGMAIVIVLVLATSLLLMGGTYWKTIQQVKPVGKNLLQKAQANILAEGILNIAILKFKELPSDFYYSYYIAKVATTTVNTAPFADFQEFSTAGSLLTGSQSNADGEGNTASYTTTFQVLSQKKYKSDAIKISVTVDLKGIRRVVSKILRLDRRRI